jgi:hypothetical protein
MLCDRYDIKICRAALASDFKQVILVLIGIAPFLGGCGLLVPQMQNFYHTEDYEKFDENNVVNQIECELH